jgi:SNF2 family DNA or RNA helicase
MDVDSDVPMVPDVNSMDYTDYPLSAKERALFHYLDQHAPSEKVIVFSQWREVMRMLECHLLARGIPCVRIDGTISTKKRHKIQEKFQAADPKDCRVLICGLGCSSEGINLQAANVVFLYDIWWNPSRTDQAEDRTHRFGQTKEVSVYYLICDRTIETQIWDMVQQKRQVSSTLLTGTHHGTRKMTWAARIKLAFQIK